MCRSARPSPPRFVASNGDSARSVAHAELLMRFAALPLTSTCHRRKSALLTGSVGQATSSQMSSRTACRVILAPKWLARACVATAAIHGLLPVSRADRRHLPHVVCRWRCSRHGSTTRSTSARIVARRILHTLHNTTQTTIHCDSHFDVLTNAAHSTRPCFRPPGPRRPRSTWSATSSETTGLQAVHGCHDG
jgi:hypothetical protein